MAHNLYNNKAFLSLRVPAWHKLGQVIEEEIGANEAFQKIGPFILEKTPLYADVNGQRVESKKTGIVANFESGESNLVSACDTRYRIIQPGDIMKAWDMITGAHVETIGILGTGENVFLSTKVKGYSVKGDLIDNYLLVNLPSKVGHSASVSITPVRVVCQNTLSWGLDQAKEEFRVIHTEGAFNRLCANLKNVWDSHTMKSQAVQDMMEILANREVNSTNVKHYLENVFPYPDNLTTNPEDPNFWKHEGIALAITEKRESVLELFEGKGKGSDSVAFKNTAFGLYNSVVEYVDYFSRHKPSSIVFGGGASLKQKACEQALALV